GKVKCYPAPFRFGYGPAAIPVRKSDNAAQPGSRRAAGPAPTTAPVIASTHGKCKNVTLVSQNAIPPTNDVAARIAAQTLAKRGPDYESEVRRLLDAAFTVMSENGTRARARLADIVTAAGLSNDAFYRHFSSKDDLIVALLEDGTQRLAGYVDHQMGKESAP